MPPRLKTAFLCRTNSPLLLAGFDLAKRCPTVQVLFLGKDIAKGLKDLVAEILGRRHNCEIEEFQVLLDTWINEIREKFRDKDGHEQYLADCEDQYLSLNAFCMKAVDAQDVLRKIAETFVDIEQINQNDPNVVVFASGHRSKGLEWERVIVLRSDLMPHPAAKDEADLEQEEHLKYVVLTRAKTELIVCYDSNPDPKLARS